MKTTRNYKAIEITVTILLSVVGAAICFYGASIQFVRVF